MTLLAIYLLQYLRDNEAGNDKFSIYVNKKIANFVYTIRAVGYFSKFIVYKLAVNGLA